MFLLGNHRPDKIEVKKGLLGAQRIAISDLWLTDCKVIRAFHWSKTNFYKTKTTNFITGKPVGGFETPKVGWFFSTQLNFYFAIVV